MPKEAVTADRVYKTTFTYRFSGHELAPGQNLKLTVTTDSYHDFEIVTDTYKPTIEF